MCRNGQRFGEYNSHVDTIYDFPNGQSRIVEHLAASMNSVMCTQHVNASRKTESILKAIRRRNVCTIFSSFYHVPVQRGEALCQR